MPLRDTCTHLLGLSAYNLTNFFECTYVHAHTYVCVLSLKSPFPKSLSGKICHITTLVLPFVPAVFPVNNSVTAAVVLKVSVCARSGRMMSVS